MNKIEFETVKEAIKTSGISKLIAGQTMTGCPLVVSGVPALWQSDFYSHGFTVYAQYHDYWIATLKSPGLEYSDFTLLQKDDCDTASEICVACRGQSRGFEGESLEWFANWLHGEEGKSNPAVLICKINGRIAGISCTATYAHGSEKGAVVWVRMLAVHPGFQGRGIGKKLLMQTLQYGVKYGARRAFLHADTENTAALRLYASAGFIPREGEGQIDMIWRNKK